MCTRKQAELLIWASCILMLSTDTRQNMFIDSPFLSALWNKKRNYFLLNKSDFFFFGGGRGIIKFHNGESYTQLRTELCGNLTVKSFAQASQIFYIEQC